MTLNTFRKQLDVIANGGYPTMSVEYITNHIAWLWKFRKITAQEKDEMCDKAIQIIQFIR